MFKKRTSNEERSRTKQYQKRFKIQLELNILEVTHTSNVKIISNTP